MSDSNKPAAARAEEELEQEGAESAKGTADDTAAEDEVDTVLAETPEPETLTQSDTLTPALSQWETEEETTATQQRQQAAARVREASALPAGIRERLAAIVEAGSETGADGRTLVALDDAIRALDESLPGALRLTGNDLARPEHPGGDGFFRTTPGSELSDDEADELARGQLARSGLLRGQKVRVAQY